MRARLGAVIIIGLYLSFRASFGADGDGVGMFAPLIGLGEGRSERASLVERERSAQRALEMGFPSLAEPLYAKLVDETPAGQDRDRLILAWTVALLEGERLDDVLEALQGLENRIRPEVDLRIALVAMRRGDVETAEVHLAKVTVSTLPASERSWFHYLVGLIAEAKNELQMARRAFESAGQEATSSLQRARFELADLEASWRVANPTEAQAQRLLRRVQEQMGERVGYDAVKRYAAVLASLGRTTEAVSFLQNQLLGLPPAERDVLDDYRLLLGLISGAESGLGRTVLTQLLKDGADRGKQRIGLRVLARDSKQEQMRIELRNELTDLLGRDPPHPIEQDLLLYRAQLAPSEEAATRDALALLERFPASDLRSAALGILVSAAWSEGRFRAAAGYATQARQELASNTGEARAQLGVLQAEAFFRGGDFRSAADAYAAALDELPTGVASGDLVFQEILARIEDDQLTVAADRIDALAGDPRLDVVNRWQAEWNLARALQAAGRGEEAYARVDRIMAEDGADAQLPTDLAVRIAWLQARLALEAGEPTRTLEQAPRLRARLAQVNQELAIQIDASLGLLEAEGLFALERSDEALARLSALRAEHVNSDAAVYSFIEEANFQAGQGQLVKAQELLTLLVTNYPAHRYAPFALYQSALMAEGRREDVYLREAIGKIEQLVTTYPQSNLVFYARFKQGDLLRKIGEWGLARQTYESIINAFPQHEDLLAAQMALADTLAAQAGGSSSLQDGAAAIYERLRDLADAPAELRIEAGLKAGNALVRAEATERATETWWQVIDAFLLSEEGDPDLGARGRYWLARILAKLGETLERQQKLDEARNAYELIRDRGLPQRKWAEAQLLRLGVKPVVLEESDR